MAIGSMLGQRIFPVSCEEWCFLGLGVPAKQLRSWRKGMGVERKREKERERESERECRMGWGKPGEQGQCWEHT
jgi:hypothetical protein